MVKIKKTSLPFIEGAYIFFQDCFYTDGPWMVPPELLEVHKNEASKNRNNQSDRL